MSRSDTQRKRRIERRAQGLCQDCGKPAVNGSSNCVKHKQLRAIASRKRAHKRREEGKCYSCGRVLDHLLTDNTWSCVYCQNRQYMYRYINGRK